MNPSNPILIGAVLDRLIEELRKGEWEGTIQACSQTVTTEDAHDALCRVARELMNT